MRLGNLHVSSKSHKASDDDKDQDENLEYPQEILHSEPPLQRSAVN